MAAAKAFARYFREETARERAAVRITRSARTYRSCQRGDALYGGAAEKRGPGGERSVLNRRKNFFGAPKRRRNAAFWPPACDKAWPDRGARGRIKSGAKFWKIKSIVSQYVPAQAACYRALAAEKNRYAEEGAEHRETAKRIFGRVKSSGWAAAFFRTTPVFIFCAERFRDARGALFERAHYTDADHLFCRCS